MNNERLILSDEARMALIDESLHPDYYSSEKLEEYLDSLNIIDINYSSNGIEVILDDDFVVESERDSYCFVNDNNDSSINYKEEYLLAA